MLHEGNVEKVIVYLNDGDTFTFTEITSVSEHTSERGALALEINYLADNETKALSKTIFVLTNNNVVHYTIIYKKNVWP